MIRALPDAAAQPDGDPVIVRFEHSLARRAVAELVGTALLLFVGAGSIPALILFDHGAGTAFAGADLGLVALAFGFTVTALVYVLGPISGCHINPAVTVAFAATRRFAWREAPAYVVAQLAGATLGSLLLWGMLGSRATRLGHGFGMASFDGGTTSWASAFLAEALAAGILVFVVLGAISDRAPQALAGMVIGLALAAIVLVIGPVTCAATNPARVFGPLLVQSVDGSGVHNWLQFLAVYTPAELVGAVAAALGYDALTERAPRARPAHRPRAVARARRARARGARAVAAPPRPR
ncbi:MAG TPA: aquaporin [Gaiellaceae bacterium]|nr:aquaporin [Gaiellaceae bacterium]